MVPEPHDTLPFSLHPTLAKYRALAERVVPAARSGDEALAAWARSWVSPLARRWAPVSRGWVEGVVVFAKQVLSPGARSAARGRLVLARCHGFVSWEAFSEHLEQFADRRSPGARFEAAVEAVIAGTLGALEVLLEADPALVRARSPREHQATLLHYLSANGVESYRQKSPANAVAVAELLLERGARPGAKARTYGRACTTLELLATSQPPREAGVQRALLQTLLERGATLGGPRRARALLRSCLANGQPEAAQFLFERGAPADLPTEAGLGHLEAVRRGLATARRAQLAEALRWASSYGRAEVVELLVAGGAKVAASDRFGQTPLHCAALAGQAAIARRLLDRAAPLEARNGYGGTPLGLALWAAARSEAPDRFFEVVEVLVEAGAAVPADRFTRSPRIEALLRGARKLSARAR